MESKNYLIFNLHYVCYGIDAKLVKEIFLLPELIPLAEAPIDIVGILNLRGKTVPIMHLDLRLGNPMQACQINDSVIILELPGLQIGVIVNTVHDVKMIEASAIVPEIDYGRERKINPAFIAGVAQIEAETIVLLNPEALVRETDAVGALGEELEKALEESDLFETSDRDKSTLIQAEDEREISDINEKKGAEETVRIIGSFYDLCCPHATLGERAIFRRRSDSLRQAKTEAITDVNDQLSTAVVGINGEYFGIDLESVREFINIRNFTPIPCCPKHIVGNINLRGEIVTLVDIRGTLNLATSTIETGTKAVVIDVDNVVAGILVNEVFDVMYLHPSQIHSVPLAANSGANDYLRCTTSYSEKMLGLIDLDKLIVRGKLAVNQEA